MADTTPLIQSIFTGLLAGGASAATTIGASWRDFKSRLAALESKVGVPGSSMENSTGLFLAVRNLEASLRAPLTDVTNSFHKLRREVDDWSEEPPTWAQRLVRKTSNASINLESFADLEARFDARIKSLDNRVKHLEEAHEDLVRKLARSNYVTQDTHDEDSRKRASDINAIRENVTTTNTLMNGAMFAQGYIERDGSPRRKR